MFSYRGAGAQCLRREPAQVLVALATLEPGENWVDEKYKRKRSMDWVPGWQLPKEWGTEDPDAPETGVRRFGLVECTYSGKGKGCKPDAAARRTLMDRFLCGTETSLEPTR